jgi:hypothetical protein
MSNPMHRCVATAVFLTALTMKTQEARYLPISGDVASSQSGGSTQAEATPTLLPVVTVRLRAGAVLFA